MPVTSLSHQGLNHNREQYDLENQIPPAGTTNYGWNNCNECFVTVMAYIDYCKSQGCTSVTNVQYFSNVETQYTNAASSSFPVGDSRSNNKATLDLSKVGVAMNRFTAPQFVLENQSTSYRYGPRFVIFEVIAKSDLELNNIEFTIGGDMTVELYTASGASAGNELNAAFWGSAHASEAITQWKKSNALIDIDIFQSFAALSLPQGSRTSFKLQSDGTFNMYMGNVGGQSPGEM